MFTFAYGYLGTFLYVSIFTLTCASISVYVNTGVNICTLISGRYVSCSRCTLMSYVSYEYLRLGTCFIASFTDIRYNTEINICHLSYPLGSVRRRSGALSRRQAS